MLKKEQLDELQADTERLLGLIKERETGFATWWMALGNGIERVASHLKVKL